MPFETFDYKAPVGKRDSGVTVSLQKPNKVPARLVICINVETIELFPGTQWIEGHEIIIQLGTGPEFGYLRMATIAPSLSGGDVVGPKLTVRKMVKGKYFQISLGDITNHFVDRSEKAVHVPYTIDGEWVTLELPAWANETQPKSPKQKP